MGPGQPIILAMSIGLEAGPDVVRGLADHAGSYGVEFEVAVATHRVMLGVDQAGLVAPFPKRAAAPVADVDVPNVASAHRL